MSSKFGTAALKRARKLFALAFIIHYMGYSLLSVKNNEVFKELFAKAKKVSTHYGLIRTPEKIQYTTQILI